ncbi:uracil-DNA glycosylase [Pannonibacter carbonis]|uniref:uracil-DNA glycosylase n=1 Tax=Pannonibacter carbonis TaxID=2067569 RepID=UPI000D0E5C64|nr:uracil-DNA glycosylase [Pannonibacter carbonis]
MIASDPTVLTVRHVEALLEFLQASGVDGFVDLDPIDRFAQSELEARRPPEPRPQMATMSPAVPMQRGPGNAPPSPPMVLPSLSKPPQTAAPVPAAAAVIPGEDAVRAARETARAAATLEDLRTRLAGFHGCNLHLTAKTLVFADGNPAARIMLVGEAPGAEEDAAGLPFVGRSGKLLDRMLAAIGLDRSSVYVTNVVPWRPPGNRTPTPQEIEICRPFILRQIELVDPDVLVLLGGASAKALTGASEPIRKMRGRWMDHDTGRRKIRALTTFDPDYLLRSPLEKRLAWHDFLALRQALTAGT